MWVYTALVIVSTERPRGGMEVPGSEWEAWFPMCILGPHPGFQQEPEEIEAWVWAKGELEGGTRGTSQGGAGSQHWRGEWPQYQAADKDLPGSLGRARMSCLGSRCWRSPARWTRTGHRNLGAYSWCGRQSSGCHAIAETVVWGAGSRSWSAENLAVQPSVLSRERQLLPWWLRW